jgi:hypothetical protein
MTPLERIDSWIYGLLIPDPQLQLVVGTPARIYNGAIRPNSEMPAGWFYSVPGNHAIRGVGTKRYQHRAIYRVIYRDRGESYTKVNNATDRTIALMDGKRDNTLGITSCTLDVLISYPEEVNGVPYRYRGAEFTILASP